MNRGHVVTSSPLTIQGEGGGSFPAKSNGAVLLAGAEVLYEVVGGVAYITWPGTPPYIVDTIALGAGSFGLASGAPNFTQTYSTNYLPAWNFDPNSEEHIGTNVLIPVGWTSFNADFYWTSAAATGNVQWALNYLSPQAGDGQVVHVSGAGGSSIVGRTGATNLDIDRILANAACEGGKMLTLNVWRAANLAGDTMTSDAQLQMVVLTKGA